MINIENWFTKWIILELNTLTFIGLLLKNNLNTSKENSISYFLIQTMRSIILMFSLIRILLFKNTLNPTLIFPLALFLKLGLAPLHLWLIPVSILRSWKILLLLSTAQKILPLILLERYRPEISSFFLIFVFISIILGRSYNLSSSSLKSVIVFSRIANRGWILLALIVNTWVWKFFLIAYFLALVFIFNTTLKKNKAIKKESLGLFLYFISIRGMPPLLGFFPKLLILEANRQLGNILLIRSIIWFTILDIFIYSRIISPLILIKPQLTRWTKSILNSSICFIFRNVILIFFFL
jgi:NADH-quinone oxidoreductase subunit N